jgi:hypothetical protein
MKDLLNEEIKDIVYVKIKILLLIGSFIWGIFILEHKKTIIFYQNNHPSVYISFVNYFIFSSLSILDIIYKIMCYFHEKNNTQNQDLLFIAHLDEEINSNHSEDQYL